LLLIVGLNVTIMVAVATLIGLFVLIVGLLLVHRSVTLIVKSGSEPMKCHFQYRLNVARRANRRVDRLCQLA